MVGQSNAPEPSRGSGDEGSHYEEVIMSGDEASYFEEIIVESGDEFEEEIIEEIIEESIDGSQAVAAGLEDDRQVIIEVSSTVGGQGSESTGFVDDDSSSAPPPSLDSDKPLYDDPLERSFREDAGVENLTRKRADMQLEMSSAAVSEGTRKAMEEELARERSIQRTAAKTALQRKRLEQEAEKLQANQLLASALHDTAGFGPAKLEALDRPKNAGPEAQRRLVDEIRKVDLSLSKKQAATAKMRMHGAAEVEMRKKALTELRRRAAREELARNNDRLRAARALRLSTHTAKSSMNSLRRTSLHEMRSPVASSFGGSAPETTLDTTQLKNSIDAVNIFKNHDPVSPLHSPLHSPLQGVESIHEKKVVMVGMELSMKSDAEASESTTGAAISLTGRQESSEQPTPLHPPAKAEAGSTHQQEESYSTSHGESSTSRQRQLIQRTEPRTTSIEQGGTTSTRKQGHRKTSIVDDSPVEMQEERGLRVGSKAISDLSMGGQMERGPSESPIKEPSNVECDSPPTVQVPYTAKEETSPSERKHINKWGKSISKELGEEIKETYLGSKSTTSTAPATSPSPTARAKGNRMARKKVDPSELPSLFRFGDTSSADEKKKKKGLASSKPTVRDGDFHSLEDLQRKRIEGIDNEYRELYLSPEDFEQHFQMTKNDFDKMPKWKRDKAKRALDLF